MSLIISLDHRENFVFITAQNNWPLLCFFYNCISLIVTIITPLLSYKSFTYLGTVNPRYFISFEVFVEGVVPAISLSVSLSFVYRTTDFLSSIFSSRI